jgi:molybdopterin converting factor subunit 1
MRVTIRLFARLREIVTTGELARQVPDDATARVAWDVLTAEFPKLAEYTTVISCAVNEEYARFDRHLKDGDEVAFLPPVSGGGYGGSAPRPCSGPTLSEVEGSGTRSSESGVATTTRDPGRGTHQGPGLSD